MKAYEVKRSAAEQKFFEDSVKYLAQLEAKKNKKEKPRI